MNIAEFSVKNRVLVNLLMIGLFLFGLVSLLRMPRELNPKVDFNYVFVTVLYSGAAPGEIESLITDPIEAEIQDVDDIKEIQSTAGEGFGFVFVKFEDISAGKFRERFTDLKAEIDKVDLPAEAEDPIIEDFDSSDFLPVITINMGFTIAQENAQHIAENLEQDLRDLNGVSKVQVSGLAKREIWVEVDPVKMNSLHCTMDEIIIAMKQRNLNVPGGNISFGKSEYLIRSMGEYQSVAEIGRTIIRNSSGGNLIRISDVARVADRREEMPILSRLNGKSSITFSVSKKGDANSIEVIDNIKTLIAGYRETVPDGVTFGWTNDNSVYIDRTLNVLRNNAITGMLLIAFVLYAFLGRANALLASLGIPISFFITFILMQNAGFSLNGNTLFALVMVLGIIVDDAIIVIENSHRYRLMGFRSTESAIRGTKEVLAPIVSSILTNIAAFLPLMLLPGIMGKFMRIIPLVFSLALIASLFEAFVLLPSHYADWTVKSRIYSEGERKFFKALRSRYTKVLFRVLRRRYLILSVLVVVLISSLAIIPLIGVEMFGEEDFDQFKVLVQFPEGTSLQESDRIMRKYEAQALKLPKDQVQDVVVNVGLLQGQQEWITRKSVAQMLIQLRPKENRTMEINRIIDQLRASVAGISGATSIEYEKLTGGPPVGKPISVKVQGKYLADIKQAALALQDSLRKIPGTRELTDDYPPGKQEIRIVVDEDKAAMFGFSIQYVALNVRYAFDGVAATSYRDGDDEIDVVVKYAQDYRKTIRDVLDLTISNAAGQTVALREMVRFDIQPGPTQIQRFDQKRTIMVTGEIDEDIITLDAVNLKLADLFKELEVKFPGISFKVGGQFEEFMNVFADITPLFLLGLILIFLILGTQFKSYSQPLIILTTVPFSLIGAMLGLLISGDKFSAVAMFGFVALAGIVVNDAIVMIDFLNNHRRGENMRPMQFWRSIVNAGRLRLRPIILTSLTTISGLIPMAFGIGGQSGMWAPLANVILFGLMVSTILTLFVIPSLVAVLDDIKKSRKKAARQVA